MHVHVRKKTNAYTVKYNHNINRLSLCKMNVHLNYKVSKNSSIAKCCKKLPANKAKGYLLPKKYHNIFLFQQSCGTYNNLRTKVLSGYLRPPDLNTSILTYPTTYM